MTQLPLPIDWRSSGQHSAIIVGDGNRDAIELLSRPDLWPSHCTLLVGPRRSGKSTIAAGIGAQVEAGPATEVIDDADRLDEALLFHRWNSAREAGRRLILVAAEAPPVWAITLPDLRSRLSASGVARIAAPDEGMVEGMIAQGLSESGTGFAPDVPRYLAPRLPRCYESVEAAIAALNDDSLSSGRKISLPRARQVLERIALLSPD